MFTLNDEWKRWVAECLMMRYDTDAIVKQLTIGGMEEKAAWHFVESAASDPYVEAGAKLARDLKKRDWLLELYQKLSETSAHRNEVERRHSLSQEEFYENYYSVNRPVILVNALQDWDAFRKWCPEYLEARFGEETVEISTHREADPPESELTEPMRFADYLHQVQNTDATSSRYLSAHYPARNPNILTGLLEDVKPIEGYLDPVRFTQQATFTLEPQNMATRLHHDLVNEMQVQVLGRRSFKFIAPHYLPNMYHHNDFYSRIDLENPDLGQYPLFKEVRIQEAVLHPGEAIFIPVAWWQHVKVQELSMSMTFTGFFGNNRYHSFQERYGELTRIPE